MRARMLGEKKSVKVLNMAIIIQNSFNIIRLMYFLDIEVFHFTVL